MANATGSEKYAQHDDFAKLRTRFSGGSGGPQTAAERQATVNRMMHHPLAAYSEDQVQQMGEAYARAHQINGEDDIRAFRLGAVLAKDVNRHVDMDELTPQEKEFLAREVTHKWAQPKLLYLVVVLCSLCAAVQGMDETVVNGAQIFYARQFGIADPNNSLHAWLLGLTNSAPSATVPIYAAETAPPSIRGALTMQWQMWTAFGIMVGFATDLIFYNVADTPAITGLNWRLMMGSAMFPAVIVCFFVYLCPESPRWYMSKGRHQQAYQSMQKLRYIKVQAARDLFYMHVLLEIEKNTREPGQNKVKEMFTVPRNRRAMVASEITMFMQQFCGVNVIAYYSSVIFVEAGFSEFRALIASLGFGIINFLFALPAVYTIDTYGRRFLLLVTFPLMALFLFFTGFSFWIPSGNAQIGCIAAGIYLFGMVYSPGEGPVPFSYSAECYPLPIRSIGMSLATATTWFFNFILSISWPSMLKAFKPQGAFSWYAGWNVIGFIAVLLFVPETKGKTLEELDQVFSIPTRQHAVWGARQVPYVFRKYILRQDVLPEVLYEPDMVEYHQDAFVKEEGEVAQLDHSNRV
ncbi:MFS sugar transporter protein [Rutstroemia sp. NJR-2017a BBW]|nr:MFS sugar transporter protein [Rutstroemia sp. NJR-2017a BBW]